MKYILFICCCALSICSFGQRNHGLHKKHVHDTTRFICRSSIEVHNNSTNRIHVALNEGAWDKYLQQFPAMDSLSTYAHSITESNYYLNSFYLQWQTKLNRKLGKFQPKIAFQFGSNYGYSISESWEKNYYTHYDTLTSSQTGQQYYLDSVTTHTFSRNFVSDRILVGAGYHLNLPLNKRFSFEAGIDVLYSFGASKRITGIHSVTVGDNNQFDSVPDVHTILHDKVSYVTSFRTNSISAQLPLEIVMKLGVKETSVWKGVSLGFKFGPVFSAMNLDTRTFTSFRMIVGGSFRFQL